MQAQAPPVLYKYMQREHANQLVNEGRMRIGTLLDFQNLENHRAEIADAQEGLRDTIIAADENGDFHLDNLTIGENRISNVSISGFGGHPFVYTERSQQFYLFCLSMTANREAMEKMGYDTCVEIHDPMGFATALTISMLELSKIPFRNKHPNVDVGPCHYTAPTTLNVTAANNTVVALSELQVYYQKLPEFAYQTEARAVWVPATEDAEPFFLQSEPAKQYCRIIEV